MQTRPCSFFTAPGLEQQVASKNIKVKLDLLTNIDMLLIVGKGSRGGTCHAIHQYLKASNKYMGSIIGR